ncbi:MAG: oligosaccharide flippase family protein, partial [bacterium]
NAAASMVQVVVGLARSILLARLLPVDIFGVYAMAGSIVKLSAVLPGFGMGDAFLHRAPETRDEDQAAAVWLTLKLIFGSLWGLLLALGAFRFASGQDRVALLTITLSYYGTLLTTVPQQILVRRVEHRRLAVLQSVDVLASAMTAILLAWRGVELWALLSTDIMTMVLSVVLLYIWRPVWRPHLAWAPSAMRYFLRFGSRSLLAKVLLRASDQVDDLWTGAYLGDSPLGLYSRAYAFATYPRSILAASVDKVAGGMYAEVAENRRRLSQAFFRTNAFLIRTGFFLGGLLASIAPELIRLLLGTKWLPMLDAFRLMLVFTLLDPVRLTVANLFVAVGRPDKIVRARAAQLAVLVAGLFALGPWLGIAGVALAVDAMLVLGIGLLLWQARDHVDFSLWTLFAAPGAAVGLGILAARAAIMVPGVLGSPWRTGLVKSVTFAVAYGGLVVILERRQLLRMLDFVGRRFLRARDSDPSGDVQA